MDKSGKWVVTRFVKDHNHPLIVTANEFSTAGNKDKKMEELMIELLQGYLLLMGLVCESLESKLITHECTVLKSVRIGFC
ncbi:putative FHY3/FAR1 family protein [Rosa chinensis]|uniref:Putative FHY3/FAR1 family protein n=1 Tax=Rosa chinensis TaxID=74649 RepID=A0A2P6RHW9_ROSCH|nr:putative FHY3/FAR1 family protein [Rosa chinensis]